MDNTLTEAAECGRIRTMKAPAEQLTLLAPSAPETSQAPPPRTLAALGRWFDTEAPAQREDDQVDWLRCLPFVALHLLCFAALWTGVSATALAVAVGLYLVRVFAITGFYHRYFSHRTFRTSRAFQFVMAVAGNMAAQRGPIWWAAHHRHHHLHAEQEPDLHSPHQHGFWRSHMLWFMTGAGFRTQTRYVRDWLRYPELRALDRYDWVVPVLLAAALGVLGALLDRHAPALGTSAAQMLTWGFVISTVAVYHATYTVNSLAHRWGRRRFATKDDSRNNAVLALLTMGEGWHNNHHHYPASARQGFFWWEIDLTYYGLVVLSGLGLIRDLRPVPAHVLSRNLLTGADGRR
jgi:stearoyl-CoA desaturase (Delta-9 desaturase)